MLNNSVLPGYLGKIFDHVLGRPSSYVEELRYIEAQIHGPVKFPLDLAGVVAQDLHRATPVADGLRRLAAKYKVPLRWLEAGKLVDD